MVKIKKKMTLPEYRERKEVYETLGYKEVSKEDISEYKIRVTYEFDENDPHYHEIRKLDRHLYRKGPMFFPIILLVAIAFTLLSVFVILLAKEGQKFDLLTNSVSYLLPAFLILAADVVYTFFYFNITKKIIEEAPLNKEDITTIVNKIRNK